MDLRHRMRRLVYVVHRWTGIGACVLMALWLASGVVMLFVGYPKLLPSERLAPLPALGPTSCCVPVATALAASRDPARVRQVLLTSVAGAPRYRLSEFDGSLVMVDARSGQALPRATAEEARRSASAFLPGASGRVVASVGDDRWTHSGGLDAHRPLWRVEMDDPDRTWLYVSSRTGEVVMDVPRVQRIWNMMGAWLHWLYLFRDGSRDAVWHWLVVGLSAVGTVSALTGAVAGLWRWRFAGRYKTGRRTPYRETVMRWHHLTGLGFGAALAAWIFSGLMSMNPFGVFDPASRPDMMAYRGSLSGGVAAAPSAPDAIELLRASGFRPVELSWQALGGEAYVVARDGKGDTRLVRGRPEGAVVVDRWPEGHLVTMGARLYPATLGSARTLDAFDALYYQRDAASMYGAAARGLPVVRLEFADPGESVVYLDVRTGDVALSVDRMQRAGRWLFNLLHSWDLNGLLRWNPMRQALLIALTAGAFAIAATGVVIGWRRTVMSLPRLPRQPRPTRRNA